MDLARTHLVKIVHHFRQLIFVEHPGVGARALDHGCTRTTDPTVCLQCRSDILPPVTIGGEDGGVCEEGREDECVLESEMKNEAM